MLNNLNASKKGMITGTVMIGLSLLFFYTKLSVESPMQYLIYIVYTAGIFWTIYAYSKSEENTNKFADSFLQGFKCFIIVTLMMVLFTLIFNKFHPEFKDEMAKAYSEDLIKKGNSTPAEISANIEKMKQYYLTTLISAAVFGYLLFGAVIAASTSLLFLKRK